MSSKGNDFAGAVEPIVIAPVKDELPIGIPEFDALTYIHLLVVECVRGFEYLAEMVGVILAGLRSGSNDWFKSIYSLTFLTLVYAAIAVKSRGAFWYGFAVAGWAYFIVGFGPWIGSPQGTQPLRAVNRNLITSIILEVVTDKLSDPDTLGGEEKALLCLRS